MTLGRQRGIANAAYLSRFSIVCGFLESGAGFDSTWSDIASGWMMISTAKTKIDAMDEGGVNKIWEPENKESTALQ